MRWKTSETGDSVLVNCADCPWTFTQADLDASQAATGLSAADIQEYEAYLHRLKWGHTVTDK